VEVDVITNNRDTIHKGRPELQTRYPQKCPADIYLSRVEGIRSPQAGMKFATVSMRNVALLLVIRLLRTRGPYENTWKHQLEIVLSHRRQVLNFAVDGYALIKPI